jgi:hypothetical protein
MQKLPPRKYGQEDPVPGVIGGRRGLAIGGVGGPGCKQLVGFFPRSC